MSPRPAASRHDDSARRFLNAAAALIDAAMTTSDQVPPRLRSLHFPAALEWIRVEDVIRLAGGSPGSSRKAFRQRWATRDEFIMDAAVYALQFRDQPPNNDEPTIARMVELTDADFGDATAVLAHDVLTFAQAQPRSYLLLHLGTVLHRHPALLAPFSENWAQIRVPFVDGYVALMDNLGLRLRPEWTPDRFDQSLHALTDGFLLQSRIRPPDQGDAWTIADHYAETVVAFTLGVIDPERTGVSARRALTLAVSGRRLTEVDAPA